MLLILLILILGLGAAVTIGYRCYIVAQWDRAARTLGARHRHLRLGAGEISGKIEGRRFRISTATVYEEGPAYFHTRAVLWTLVGGSLGYGYHLLVIHLGGT